MRHLITHTDVMNERVADAWAQEVLVFLITNYHEWNLLRYNARYSWRSSHKIYTAFALMYLKCWKIKLPPSLIVRHLVYNKFATVRSYDTRVLRAVFFSLSVKLTCQARLIALFAPYWRVDIIGFYLYAWNVPATWTFNVSKYCTQHIRGFRQTFIRKGRILIHLKYDYWMSLHSVIFSWYFTVGFS